MIDTNKGIIRLIPIFYPFAVVMVVDTLPNLPLVILLPLYISALVSLAFGFRIVLAMYKDWQSRGNSRNG